MNIPEFIKLPPSKRAFIDATYSSVTGILKSSPEFFPEYTDHGIEHIELTLDTACNLMTDKARKLLTEDDWVVLTTAVILHDFGMHLTRDGFKTLISAQRPWGPIQPFDTQSWGELWDDFFAEARRYDDRKLKSIFGDHYRNPRPLPLEGLPWDDFDRLLVGEFLRQHHPRLSHEIALYGFPSISGSAKSICPTTEHSHYADMAGLIARSHGMPLRPCLDYLTDNYHNRVNPITVHATFLMVLLRIADFFQIQATRAPKEIIAVRKFNSPMSILEWSLHQCINDVSDTGEDPEALTIIAKPKDVETFLRLKSWLQELQQELDTSWAILGEAYGRQKKLNALGIQIRRVKSNLDNITNFAATVSYIPARLQFESSNVDMLKLLIGPLYDYSPKIGIRELIQNAVDAVRELEDLVDNQHPEWTNVDRYEQECDVVVHFECDKDKKLLEISVTDRGIGMTVDVIRNYFLKAGASFRKSDQWKHQHEAEPGQSRVLRSGRFGIGALAAFLLGDEITVTTRHITQPQERGVTFSARIDSLAISAVYTNCPVGTCITIKVNNNCQYLHNNFNDEPGIYYLKKPSLCFSFSHSNKKTYNKKLVPQPEEMETIYWRFFSNRVRPAAHWAYGSHHKS